MFIALPLACGVYQRQGMVVVFATWVAAVAQRNSRVMWSWLLL